MKRITIVNGKGSYFTGAYTDDFGVTEITGFRIDFKNGEPDIKRLATFDEHSQADDWLAEKDITFSLDYVK